jgi:hypothetical protein
MLLKGWPKSIVTWTPWPRGYARAETAVQQTQRLHRKTDPSPRRRDDPISKHVHVKERTKIFVMDLEEAEARNDCAGEGVQAIQWGR